MTKRRVPLDREESTATEEDVVTEEGAVMKRRVRGEVMREGGRCERAGDARGWTM
jgi:hypothetical protein